MSNHGMMAKVALPYAEALLEFAQENNSVDKTNQDLSLITELLSKSVELQSFLENPLITSAAKKQVLNKLLFNQVNSFILKFLLVLVDRRRFALLNLIIEKYLKLAYQLDSITIAQISTAVAFTEIQQMDLVQKLKQMTNSKEVKLIITIDSTLIGGLIIQIGSKVIDTSLAGKLKRISFYLSENLN